MANRIVLVEDHGLIAHTLSTALRVRGADIVEIDPVAHDRLLIEVLREEPSLVLLDLDLGPWGDATPLIGPLTESGARVVIVTGLSDPLRHAACVRAGAVGVLSKSSSFEDLQTGVERVLAGEELLSRHERDELLAELRHHENGQRDRMASFEQLSQREQEVLGLLMHGCTVEQIARESYVSVATVRTQVRAILAKLQVSSQLVAVGKAREAGWIPPQER